VEPVIVKTITRFQFRNLIDSMMRNYISLIIIVLVNLFYIPSGDAADIFAQYEKVIWVNQLRQVGVAYEGGNKLREFPVMTGDDETTTDPGIYIVKAKDEYYHSKKYDTPMPYSIFFDLKQRKAIHEGEVPPFEERKDWATHGCIHVEPPDIEWLYDWVEEGKTVVVIQGWRTGD
jgi:lipoprotein-anchoring transpeptidase ErfK/SrfK